MRTLRVVCRIEKKTQKPIIFYHGQDGLECYTFQEQHATSSQGYYNDGTRLAGSDQERAECDRLVRHYRAQVKLRDYVELEVGVRLHREVTA